MTSRCRSCGGRDFTDAIDNHGKVYRGCARCRIMPSDPRWIEGQRTGEPATGRRSGARSQPVPVRDEPAAVSGEVGRG